MVYSSLRASLRNVALAALAEYPNVKVIFSHQRDGTEPAGSYVVVGILSVDQQGHATTSTFTNPSEKLKIQSSYEVKCQFSFVGSDSGNLAYSFNQRINNNPNVIMALSKNNLGFMRKSQVRRAPQKRDTTWVEYHNTDVTFSYTVVSEELIAATIQGVTTASTFETSMGTIDDEYNIPFDLTVEEEPETPTPPTP